MYELGVPGEGKSGIACAELSEAPNQPLPAEAPALALPDIPQSEGPRCAAD